MHACLLFTAYLNKHACAIKYVLFSFTAPNSRIYYVPVSENSAYLVVTNLNENDVGRYVCAAGIGLRVAMTLVVYGMLHPINSCIFCMFHTFASSKTQICKS